MKYRHYPLDLAVVECKEGQKKRYKITTINWTFAGQNRKKGIDYNKVHKNEHVWTLQYLIKWIRETEDVAENIIKIEPVNL